MKKALVLGNGKSRIGFPIPKGVSTYGCNAIYRDMNVDNLVSVDVAMQHEIYRSEYCKDNVCFFPQWDILSYEQAQEIKSQHQGEIDEWGNESENCSISGKGNTLYVSWLYDDSVITIDQSYMSAGTTALQLAIKHGFTQIYLTGFDIENSDNIYLGSLNYENSSPNLDWYQEHMKTYVENEKVSFYPVDCLMQEIILPNVNQITVDTFLGMTK